MFLCFVLFLITKQRIGNEEMDHPFISNHMRSMFSEIINKYTVQRRRVRKQVNKAFVPS